MIIGHLLVSDEIILVFGHYLWRIFLIVNHFMVRENKNLPWVNLFLVLRQSKSPITTLTWAMKFCFSFLFFCFFFIFLIYYYCRYTYTFVTSPFLGSSMLCVEIKLVTFTSLLHRDGVLVGRTSFQKKKRLQPCSYDDTAGHMC